MKRMRDWNIITALSNQSLYGVWIPIQPDCFLRPYELALDHKEDTVEPEAAGERPIVE